MKLLTALILAVLVLPATAQDATVTTEIVTIAINDPVADLYFHNGKEVAVFQANPTGIGEPLTYKGPQRFCLRSSREEFALQPPLPAPHASVDLPAGSQRVLIACMKSGQAPVKLVAYDIGRARLAAGDYRIFNFSHSDLSVILGEKKFAVKPGMETLVSDASWKKDILEIDVAIAIVKDGRAKPVYSSQWGHRPGRRNFIFMFDGPQEYKPVRICRFFDVPPAESEAPKR